MSGGCFTDEGDIFQNVDHANVDQDCGFASSVAGSGGGILSDQAIGVVSREHYQDRGNRKGEGGNKVASNIGYAYLSEVPDLTDRERSVIMAADQCRDARLHGRADRIVAERARMVRQSRERALVAFGLARLDRLAARRRYDDLDDMNDGE